MRTTVTSTAIAVASPTPIIFTTESASVTKPRKTAVMIAPAVPITLAVRPTRVGHGRTRVAGAQVLLAHP